MDKVLLFFSLKYNSNWQKVYSALERKEKILDSELNEVDSKINCNYITILNPLYPLSLKNSHKPPFVIFYRGNIDLLLKYQKISTFIYEDKMESYILDDFFRILNSLVKTEKTFLVSDFNLMSSFINKSIKQKTNNWIELHKEMKNLELKDNQSLIISEAYENNKNSIDFTNRVLLTLAMGIIILEVNKENKLLNSTMSLIHENKDIFVLPLPNNLKNKSNNFLIQQGAKLVQDVNDITSEF